VENFSTWIVCEHPHKQQQRSFKKNICMVWLAQVASQQADSGCPGCFSYRLSSFLEENTFYAHFQVPALFIGLFPQKACFTYDSPINDSYPFSSINTSSQLDLNSLFI